MKVLRVAGNPLMIPSKELLEPDFMHKIELFPNLEEFDYSRTVVDKEYPKLKVKKLWFETSMGFLV